jgi:hypothetical protein
MARATQEYYLALAPPGILIFGSSDKNLVGDLPRGTLIDSIGVPSETPSFMYTTRDFANITKDRRG